MHYKGNTFSLINNVSQDQQKKFKIKTVQTGNTTDCLYVFLDIENLVIHQSELVVKVVTIVFFIKLGAENTDVPQPLILQIKIYDLLYRKLFFSLYFKLN